MNIPIYTYVVETHEWDSITAKCIAVEYWKSSMALDCINSKYTVYNQMNHTVLSLTIF